MPNMKASLEIRKVKGIESSAVTTAMCGASAAGIAPATLLAMASVMPVPLRTPVKIPAAKITENLDVKTNLFRPRCADMGRPFLKEVSSCPVLASLLCQWPGRCVVTRFAVEPLPARPSLEMQRKLAKRLLRDAWSGNAEAIARAQTFHPGRVDPDAMKLHNAQLVIARGYGFESWAAMAQKIESLTMTPIERFDGAVRAGQAEQVHELLIGHADIAVAA